MFTTLAGRALVPVGIAVTGFVVVCYLLLYSAIRNSVNRSEVAHATNLADTVLKSTRYAMLKSDRETLTTVIRNIGEQKGVEHVRIFNKKGVVIISSKPDELNRQVDKKAEGCIVCHSGPVAVTTLGTMQQARHYRNSSGIVEMAITAPIYNEPECSNAACHIHLPEQKVLGTLDIGLSQEPLIKSLAGIRMQMIIFSLMTLILTVGGVTALLMRSVFIPVRRLREFAEQAGEGALRSQPPPHLPHDLDTIAKSLYKFSREAGSFHKVPETPENDALRRE